MPEAPWIRRWNAEDSSCAIKFTDNILMQEQDEDEEVGGGPGGRYDIDEGGVDISEIRDEFDEKL
jgi:hypothetical protein